MNASQARALGGLLALQKADGSWEGEMVWNTMILSQYVIVRTIIVGGVGGAGGVNVGRAFGEGAEGQRTRAGIIRHYEVSQARDGSWGMHPESSGYVFFTSLAYVALRLLGLSPEHPMLASARRWLEAQPGGVLSVPTWGKYWLSFIGLYEWSGVNPISPELHLLPSLLPFHPSKYYCHTRNIYVGLSFLYGMRFRADLGPITAALRAELYRTPWEEIDFPAHRHDVAKSDLYVRPSSGVRIAQDLLKVADGIFDKTARARALDDCFDRILYEQRQSRYQGISPVNGLLDCLALYARDPMHPDLAPSLEGVEAWRWQDEAEGIRYAGARSNTWDTAFAMQAILAGPAAVAPSGPDAASIDASLRRGYRSLVATQMTEELPDWKAASRDPALGGWCFSDGTHRWPVSDCTAEAMTALLLCHERPGLIAAPDRIPRERLGEAVDFLCHRQNDDGGFGTYERRRGSTFLEKINPTEMYGQCMTERSYLECTASSVAALAHLRAADPGLRADKAQRAIDRGVAFLRASQRDDGSFPGFWGINFTYGIFHVIKGLRAAGVSTEDPLFTRAAEWLVSTQREDGGWGEHWKSCLDERYVEHSQSQSVMTSWAVLSLLEVMGPHAEPVRRGVAWLCGYVRDPGQWKDAVNGVFFGSAMLDYRYYKHYFPLWALARTKSLSDV